MADTDLTIEQAAEYLKLPRETVYKYARAGQIPAAKVGGRWCFRREEIDAWVRAHENVFRQKRGPRILVVDDEPWVRNFLVGVFEMEGYPVSAAAGGREALVHLDQDEFDLVFLDLMMPDMNGVEVLREIKKMAPVPEVVIVTGYYESDLMKQALEMGPINVLKKPVGKDDLLRVVRAYGPSGPA